MTKLSRMQAFSGARLGALGLVAGAMALTSTPAAADNMSADDLADALRAEGLSPSVSQEGGQPAVFASVDGFDFALIGFSCTSDAACAEYVFNAFFDIGADISLNDINDFNEAAVAGRAYIDPQGDANIEHMFSANDGDVASHLSIWRQLLADFQLYLESAMDQAGS